MASRRLSPLASLLLFFAGACDGGPTPIEPAAGSRLAPLYREVEGTRIFVGWFDRELQTECALVDDREGQIRCYPTGSTLWGHTDPQCASPLVQLACPGTRFRTEISFGQAPQSFSLTPVGAVPPLFLKQQDMCVAASEVPSARLPATASVVTSTPIAADALVQMHHEVVPLNEELEILVRVGSDGSRSPHEWRDRKRAKVCFPAWTEHGLRCLPGWSSPHLQLSHVDSACMLPLLQFGGAAGDIVALPDAGPPNAPPGRSPFGERLIALYRLAPVAKDIPTFLKTPAGCEPQAVTGEGQLAAAERIDVRAFPKLGAPSVSWLGDTMFQVGDQRVVLDEPPGKLHEQAGGSCRLAYLQDGRMACLQGDHPIFATSRDGCGELAYFDPFVTPRRLLVQEEGHLFCTPRSTKLYALTPLAEPPLDPRGESCGIPQDPQGFQHPAFAVGPEVAPGPDGVILGEPVPSQ